MLDYAKILEINYPLAKWTLDGYAYEGLNWLDESPKPTQAELDALWESTQAILQNQQAEYHRASAYVTEADPLFFKAQRGEVTLEEWKAKVAEIKSRYPKM